MKVLQVQVIVTYKQVEMLHIATLIIYLLDKIFSD